MGFRERKALLLSAILLKQCRVPRTLNFACFRTKDCTSSSNRAEVRFSVPYSRFPAQFFNLSPSVIHANRGAIAGVTISTEAVLRNRRLFMIVSRGRGPSFRLLKHRCTSREPPFYLALSSA